MFRAGESRSEARGNISFGGPVGTENTSRAGESRSEAARGVTYSLGDPHWPGKYERGGGGGGGGVPLNTSFYTSLVRVHLNCIPHKTIQF